MHLQLHTVRQSLAARSVRCGRADPYPDGRCRFYASVEGGSRFYSDDIEEVYIKGLRMASARDHARTIIHTNAQYRALERSRNAVRQYA